MTPLHEQLDQREAAAGGHQADWRPVDSFSKHRLLEWMSKTFCQALWQDVEK